MSVLCFFPVYKMFGIFGSSGRDAGTLEEKLVVHCTIHYVYAVYSVLQAARSAERSFSIYYIFLYTLDYKPGAARILRTARSGVATKLSDRDNGGALREVVP